MRNARCEDCGCQLAPWDLVFDWPGVGGICENCMESRVWDLNARETAERMGIVGQTVGELGD